MKKNTPFSRRTPAILMLCLVALLSFHNSSASAQTPETKSPTPEEVEQLKKRLQLLKQTVLELKTQIGAIEEKKNNPTPSIVEASTTPPAKPQDNSKGESTFQVYGFAMLDAGYQFKQNHPDWFGVIRPVKLPSFPNEFAPNGKVYYGVRQSRFGVKSSTPTDYGELKTHFEFELFGTGVDAGQTTFRLRHAYGELGQFGAGQTWSPFMDIDVFPNWLEYWGPNGMVFFRNVQFRWMPLKGRNSVTLAIERPGASADQGRFQDRIELQGIRPKFDLPDFSGNVRFTRDQGIQNYMNDAPVDVGIEITPGGDPRRPITGVALPMWSMVAFLDHNWNKRFSTAIGYSMLDIDNSNGQTPNAFRRGHYALGNLLFYPTESPMVGGEFQWGRRENFWTASSQTTSASSFHFATTFPGHSHFDL